MHDKNMIYLLRLFYDFFLIIRDNCNRVKKIW